MNTRGLIVSVGFDDLLALTLPRAMRHLTQCLIVTSPDDHATQAVARSVPGARLFITDAFTRHGAPFNKGLAVEEALDDFGREGWLLIFDADVIIPDDADWSAAHPGHLHGARRVILENPADWRPDLAWRHRPAWRDDPAIGYFQLFHADAPAVRDRRPWYDPTFAHAGGCDAHFRELWPRAQTRILPFPVLHLGPVATNWYGRAAPRLDGAPLPDAARNLAMMNGHIHEFGWTWARPHMDRAAIAAAPPAPHRVAVPGYSTTAYEMPHIRHAHAHARARRP
jgi:hypothetical protein